MNTVQIMSSAHDPPLAISRIGHEWSRCSGSNVSFICARCGITGYLPAKGAENDVKTTEDCDEYVVESVLTD